MASGTSADSLLTVSTTGLVRKGTVTDVVSDVIYSPAILVAASQTIIYF
jgi:hypothetical protein